MKALGSEKASVMAVTVLIVILFGVCTDELATIHTGVGTQFSKQLR